MPPLVRTSYGILLLTPLPLSFWGDGGSGAVHGFALFMRMPFAAYAVGVMLFIGQGCEQSELPCLVWKHSISFNPVGVALFSMCLRCLKKRNAYSIVVSFMWRID